MATKKSKNKNTAKTEKKSYGPSNLQIAFLIVSAILILSMVLSLIKI
jgi:hypothetical protein